MKSFASIAHEKLTPIDRTQMGSNPGGIHTDQDGQRHYVKFYHNPHQAHAEVLAGKVYDHLGVKTTNARLVHLNGRVGVASHFNDDLVPIHHEEFSRLQDHQKHALGKMFYGSVLTKNWDVIGMGYDNVMKHRTTGEIHSIDHGGAFHFRAQGSPKPYGPDIGEHHSLVHNESPSGDVFGQVLNKKIHHVGLLAVSGMDMAHMKDSFGSSGLPNHKQLFENFAARRNALLENS